MFRLLEYILISWLVYRILDNIFTPSPRRHRDGSSAKHKNTPASSFHRMINKQTGEYIDYEEVN